MAISRVSSQFFSSLIVSASPRTIASYDPGYSGTEKGRIVFVCVKSLAGAAGALISITYGGIEMTVATASVINNFVMSYGIYYIVNPPSGAQNIVMTSFAGSFGYLVGVIAYSDNSDYIFRMGGTAASQPLANYVYGNTVITTSYANAWSIALSADGSGQNIINGNYLTGNGNPSNFEVVDSNGVVAPNVNTGVTVSIATISDFLDIFYYDSSLDDIRSNSIQQVGQTFYNVNSMTLTGASMFTSRQGSPTGNMVAKIYAMTGTYGTNGKPTGAALATSDNVTAGTAQSFSNRVLVNFVFSGANQIILAATTHYCLVLDANSVTGTSSAYLRAGLDASAPAHGGNMFYSTDSTNYTTDNTKELIFFVFNGTPGNIFQSACTFLAVPTGAFQFFMN